MCHLHNSKLSAGFGATVLLTMCSRAALSSVHGQERAGL